MVEYYDVCVICALPEEATAFIEVLKTHGAQPEEIFIPQLKRTYYRANILNIAGETLNIVITWLPDMGTINIMADFGRFLDHFPIRFAAMTGICAGYKDKVKLGDLVIASRTYLYDAGSNIINDDGESEHKWDTKTTQITNDILHAAQMFTKWKEEARQIPRPYSKHQQQDWLLNTLFQENKSVYDIDILTLQEHAPDWNKIVAELQKGEEPFLDKNTLALIQPTRIKKLIYGQTKFPYIDPPEPTHYIAPMASGNAVRKDKPFAEITVPVSKALALDMESMAFYSILQNYDNIRALLVKGVCDYADKDKDDSYHAYASTISAIYMYAFIKEFVTNARMPWPTDKKPGLPAVINIQEPQTTIPTTQITPVEPTVSSNDTATTDKKSIKIFFSCSESSDDADLIKRLDKHLTLLKRQLGTENWYKHNIDAGGELQKEIENHLKEADIIILLLTLDYISADFYDEEYRLIKILSAQGTRVIPILLRSIDDEGWKKEFYGKFQPLPRDGKPVDTYAKPDIPLAKIAGEIREVVTKHPKSIK